MANIDANKKKALERRANKKKSGTTEVEQSKADKQSKDINLLGVTSAMASQCDTTDGVAPPDETDVSNPERATEAMELRLDSFLRNTTSGSGTSARVREDDEAKPSKLRRVELPSGSAEQPRYDDDGTAPEQPRLIEEERQTKVHTQRPPLTEAQLQKVAANKATALQRATLKREQ